MLNIVLPLIRKLTQELDEIQEGKWDANIAVEFGSPQPEASASGTPKTQPFAIPTDSTPVQSDEETRVKDLTTVEASILLLVSWKDLTRTASGRGRGDGCLCRRVFRRACGSCLWC